MVIPPDRAPFAEEFSVERAEELLGCLIGVKAARVVAPKGAEIQEIHLLTTDEVSPKQTVRNVESALAAHFGVSVDHRKISVAQAAQRTADAEGGADSAEDQAPVRMVSLFEKRPSGERRMLFLGHQIETQRSQQARVEVALEWEGRVFKGQGAGADLPRSRFTALANATLRAMESALASSSESAGHGAVTLALDGIKVVDAFDRSFMLVAVHAFEGREVTSLTGASSITDSPDRSVVLATLHATDRWVRGRI